MMWHRRLTLALAALALPATVVFAQHDHPSAIVLYPYVAADAVTGLDTVIQLTNVSNASVDARCVYEDFTPECTTGTAGESCGPGPRTCTGLCVPNPKRRAFHVRITPSQPLAWRLSQGLSDAPLDGVERVGPGGATNEGTEVPAIEPPMFGTLRCVVVDADGSQPLPDNVLAGLATIEERDPVGDAWQYRALGFRALDGALNQDGQLHLGGADAEYEGCPALVSLEHIFDGAPLRTGDLTAHVEPSVILSTCAMGDQGPAAAVAQFLVYNEFGQRFSTSRQLEGQRVSRLAMIDTFDPTRSIFAVGVAGTLAGHTLIAGVGSGLIVVGADQHIYADDRRRSVGFNAHGISVRTEGDIIPFAATALVPACVGDCNTDGTVRVNELVTGVNIALEQLGVDRCEAFDQNRDLRVTVNEVVMATSFAIGSCPVMTTPTATPAVSEPAVGASLGTTTEPGITVLGLTTADDRPLEPDVTDDEGRPVFVRPFGHGMTLLVEARQGRTETYNAAGGLPDLQVLVSQPLGDGGEVVCEEDGRTGGVPGNPALDFDAPGAAAAINDLGCRAYARRGLNVQAAFAKPAGDDDVWGFLDSGSTVQFGIPIAKAWAFPLGRTIVAARVRTAGGTLSPIREIVIDVTGP